MPDKRIHRGPHPEDASLFGPACVPTLRAAMADYVWLLNRGYADKSALKLVGDHFSLLRRQRLALMRSACSDQQVRSRLAHRVTLSDLAGQGLIVDGYNLLITLEAALSGAWIFQGCDGCLRDLAGVHGTYRQVAETMAALELIGHFLNESEVSCVTWLMDSPVSNSGRLKTLMGQMAEERRWPWDIQLSVNPDAQLKTTHQIIVTTDSVILDHCRQWVNLAADIIPAHIPHAKIVNLGCSIG
ncbi:MAG: DUF434 domain-containing protein [Phycisphaerae bacterium]|nr:DUF434 domain-containing protein [Phycisphaerae bacterium]